VDAIGNTPLVELLRIVPKGSARVFAKMESANPTGSMKDRLARRIIGCAAKVGDLQPGGTVVEYTAGTTGISLALVAGALGYKAHFVFSDAFSDEKRLAMRAYGAQITDIPSINKRITTELIRAMIAKAGEIGCQPGHWFADQLNNDNGADGYTELGEEIWAQTGIKPSPIPSILWKPGAAAPQAGCFGLRRRAGRIGCPFRMAARLPQDRGYRAGLYSAPLAPERGRQDPQCLDGRCQGDGPASGARRSNFRWNVHRREYRGSASGCGMARARQDRHDHRRRFRPPICQHRRIPEPWIDGHESWSWISPT
jgi:Pyridoxal-phosphate dependent enzyme